MNDIKNQILDKAKERMSRFGYKKTTMDEISKDCKISKKTIYEFFTDKEDMFKNLLLRETHMTMEILFARISETPDPLERIIQLIRTAISYLNEDNFITRVLKDNDDLFSEFLRLKYHTLIDEEIISRIAAIIQEGKAQGKFRDVDEKIVAYAGFKLFEAFSYMRTRPLCPDRDEEHAVEVLIDFIVNAIIKK